MRKSGTTAFVFSSDICCQLKSFFEKSLAISTKSHCTQTQGNQLKNRQNATIRNRRRTKILEKGY